LKAHWKGATIAVAIVGTVAGGYFYVQHVKHEAYASGFTAAEDQAKAQVIAANNRLAADNTALKQLQIKFSGHSVQRQQQVKIVTQTKIERIHDEVQSNPVYAQCRISDGVRAQLEDLTSAVNTAVSSGQR